MMEGWPSGCTALLTARLPYKYAIPLFAAVFAIALASTVGSAWAQDVAQDQTVESAPRSYHRGISDGLSVTSNFGNPAPPNHVPRSYTRSLSETVSVASSFQSPSHSGLAESQGPQRAPANYSPAAGQRIDERSGNRVLLGNKGDSRINGAAQYSGTPQVTLRAPAEGDFDFSEMATLGDGGGSDPDDNLLRYIVATTAADHYSGASAYVNAVFGAYSLAVIIIVAARSHRFASAGKTVVRLGMTVLPARLVALSSVQAGKPAQQTKSLLIAVVTVLVVVSAGSAVGQAFADSAAGVAYKSGTGNGVNYPKYREWDPATTSWSAEVELPTSGAELYGVKFLYSPSSSLRVVGTLGSDGEIEIYYCDNACTTASKWTGPLLVADMGTPTAGYKYFDIAFEATSGDLLIVYDKTTLTDTVDFFYKTFDSVNLTLSGESAFDYTSDATSDNDIRFFKMAYKPGSDEIAMVLLDATLSDTYAFIWNGASFGNQLQMASALGAPSLLGEAIGIAYETTSGAALAFTALSQNNVVWARYAGSWSGPTTINDPNPGAAGEDAKWVSLKADPASGSNKVMVCFVDDLSDFSCGEFNAAAPGLWTRLELNVVNNAVRPADFAWDPTGSTGFVIYYESAAGDLRRRTWTSSTATWSGETSVVVANVARWVVAATDFDTAATGIDSLWAIYGDAATDDIGDGEWDAGAGTPWVLNGETAITGNAGTTNTVEVVAIDSQRSREVKRYISDDTLAIGDTISMHVTRSITETSPVIASDSISIHVTRSITEPAIINNDSIARTYFASRSVTEPAIINNDSISIHVTRSIADAVTITDAMTRTFATPRSISDTLTITDSMSMHVTRSSSDSLAVTDSVATSLAASRSTSDTMTIGDAITIAVSRSISDTLTVTDSTAASKAFPRSIADTITVTDSVAMSVTRSTSDTLTVSDTIAMTLNASRSMADTVTVSDATAISVTRSIADNLAVSDAIAFTKNINRSISDSLAVSDSITIHVTRSTADALTVTDAITRTYTTSRSTTDSVTLADTISAAKSFGRQASDTLTLTDAITVTASFSRSASDTLTVTDSVVATLTGVSRSASDSLAVTDAIAATYAASRSIADALAITDSISTAGGNSPSVGETLTVTDAITNVAVHWNRDFSEVFTLGDCTPFACNQALVFGESLTIGAGITPPPSAADTVAISDSIALFITVNRGVSDTVSVSDNPEFMWVGVPPTPPLGSPVPPVSLRIASDSALVVPLPGAPASGNYTLVTPNQIVTLLNPPTLVNTAVAAPDLPQVVKILPTYHVSLTPSSQLPGDDLMLTGKVAAILAGTPVMVPVDIAGTPQAAEHSNIPWMMLEYTPSVVSTDFALLVTIIDAPPAGAQQPPAALKPMYIDFGWEGIFSSQDPGVSAYYASPPTLTFAVTDSWATAQNVQRNANNVPIMAVSLLNPSTGTWTPVSIDLPAGQVNGQYVYVAHLDHFSTYAITANAASAPVVTGSGRSGASYTVELADALTITGEGRVLEAIEEFGQKGVRVGIVDALTITARPVSFKTLTVGEDVEVNIGVEDVEQASVIPPKAEATIQVQAENSGTDQEEFQLIFSYYDQAGRKAHQSSQVVELAPGESRLINVEVPFTSPGTYDIIAEVRSIPEGELLNTTQLTVTVPWLAINLYLLIVAAAMVLSGSGAAITLFVRSRKAQ